jgi:hypothetical protein
VLTGRGLCYELISRPDESYRLWCIVVCDLETSRMRRPWPALGRSATATRKSRKDGYICFSWPELAVWNHPNNFKTKITGISLST